MAIVGLYTYREAAVTTAPEEREYLRLLGYDTETDEWAPHSDGRKAARIPEKLIRAVSSADEAQRVFATVFDGWRHVVARECEIPGSVETGDPPEEPVPLSDS